MTVKQSKAMTYALENGGNVSKAMTQAGYSKAMAKNPQKLTRSQAWIEVMEEAGLSDRELAKTLREGLKASKTVTSLSGDILATDPDYAVRHKYLDTALKIKGAYKDSESGSLHFHQHITGNRGEYGL